MSLIRKITLPNAAYITNTFDSVGRLTDTSLKDIGGGTLNGHTYLYNLAGQRTRQTRIGGDYVDYTYDDIGQLKTATGKESGGTTRLNEKYGYSYDAGGNLYQRTNNALTQTFSVNNLNQLTTAGRSGTLTVAGTSSSSATSVTVNGSAATRYADYTFAKDAVSLSDGTNTFTATAQDSSGRSDSTTNTVYLPATVTFAYDSNGNLLSDGRRGFDYDDENQLVRVTVTNAWKSEFSYDGKQRRRLRKEFTWQNSAWAQTAEVRYVYDGMLVIQERDGNNLPLVTYTRGLDLGGGLQAAGGIGGLLARTDNGALVTQPSGAHAYYHGDGNGNVTMLVSQQKSVLAHYVYDPYGNLISSRGPMAEVNLYRFSSKETHAASGLVYFGFRYYDVNLQRWVNRDPVAEPTLYNLHRYSNSDPLNSLDPFGLDPIDFVQRVELQRGIDDFANRWAAVDRTGAAIIHERLTGMLNSGRISVALLPGDQVGRASGAIVTDFAPWITIDETFLRISGTAAIGHAIVHEYAHLLQNGMPGVLLYGAANIIGRAINNQINTINWLLGNGWDADLFYRNKPTEIWAAGAADKVYSNGPVNPPLLDTYPLLYPPNFIGPLPPGSTWAPEPGRRLTPRGYIERPTPGEKPPPIQPPIRGRGLIRIYAAEWPPVHSER